MVTKGSDRDSDQRDEVSRLSADVAAMSSQVAALLDGQARLTELLKHSLTQEFVVQRKVDLDLSADDEGEESQTIETARLRRPRTKALFGSAPRATIE